MRTQLAPVARLVGPPNGVVTRTDEFEFSERSPLSIARATCSARAPLRVQTEPLSP